MADKLVQQALVAFLDEDYPEAIDLYTKALELSPNDPHLYVSRAQAFLKQEDYLNAISDADKAIEISPELAKAHLRKGIALFQLEEYESAQEALQMSLSLENKPETETWLRKCQAELEDEERSAAANAPSNSQPSANEHADAQPSTPTKNDIRMETGDVASTSEPEKEQKADEELTKPIAKAAPAEQTRKYRHQFFQTQNIVEVAVLAKNLTPDRVNVTIEERSLRVVIKSPEGDGEYDLPVDLYDKVVPSESKFELLKTKIEIRLKKASVVSWPTLEKSEKKIAANFSNTAMEQPPSYPSSFTKARNVNWDKLEHEIKSEEKDEKLEGEQALQKMFRDIYSSGDEEMRRAMNKSFQESNGTVLSTNWKDVGKGKVTCSPPDGMEARKYEI